MLYRSTLHVFICCLSFCLASAQSFSDKIPLITDTGFESQEDLIVPAIFGIDKAYFVQFTDGTLRVLDIVDDEVVEISKTEDLPSLHMVSFGDFNLDGNVDILTNQGIMFNQGGENFASPTLPGSFNLTGSIQRYVDVNQDGFVDFVASAGSKVQIYYTNASYQVINVAEIPTTETVRAIQTTDFDQDGDVDIIYLISEFTANDQVVLLTNDGSQNFSSTSISTFSLNRNLLLLSDLDNDTDTDLLLSGTSDNLSWVRNDDGALSEVATLDGSVDVQAFNTADFNDDGNTDIVILEDTDFENYKLMVFLGNGDGSLQPGVEIGQVKGLSPLGVPVGAAFENWISIYDYNEDGKEDILVNELVDQQFSVFLNNTVSATVSFEDPSFQLSPNPAQSILQLSWAGDHLHQVRIYDAKGTLHTTIAQTASGQNINIAHLPAGIYVLQALDQNRRFLSRRFIKH